MRKQLLSFLGATALCMGFAGAAHAQYSLIVNSPANLQGSVTGTVDPTNTAPLWGFGDPALIVPGVTGDCQYAGGDTLAGPSYDIGDQTGKICVIHRGA
jgi:hypothetical protein